MQQAQGTCQYNVAAPDHDPLAAHAAQARKIVLGAEAPAIDDEIVALRPSAVAETERHALGQHRIEQEAQRSFRGEMGLLRIEERAGEAVAKRRLERGKLRCRQAPMPAGHAGEAVELGAVAMQRHHQRAVGNRAGIGLPP